MANIIDAEIAEMKAVCKSLSLGATWEFACETRYFLPRLLDAYEAVVRERDQGRFDHGNVRGDYDREIGQLTARIAELLNERDALRAETLK